MIYMMQSWPFGGCQKPVVASIHGAAAGAGFSLAMACDLIIATEDAVFTLAYSVIGASPGRLFNIFATAPNWVSQSDGANAA